MASALTPRTLNVIDTLREANSRRSASVGHQDEQRFAGTAVETNAMFAALRTVHC
jgi:hypothetical protein